MKCDWKAAIPVVDFHPTLLFSTEKFLFYGWPILVWSQLFSKLAGLNYKNYCSHAGQVKQKVNCGELSVEITFLGLPHIVNAASETWPNLCTIVNSTLAWMDAIPNVNFALSSSNNRVEPRDLYNYLNQKVITAINIP